MLSVEIEFLMSDRERRNIFMKFCVRLAWAVSCAVPAFILYDM